MPPRSRPDDYEPPYPAYRLREGTRSVYATALVGVQAPEAEDASHLAHQLLGLFAADDIGRPMFVEQAWHIDPQGYRNQVLLPYWPDGEEMNRFFERADVVRWRRTPRTGPVGWWRESLHGDTSSADIANSAKVRYGITRVSEIEEVQFHGYMGSMRDRVPDYLSGKADGADGRIVRQPAIQTRGRHLVVDGLPHNLCFIRAPFGARHATPSEQEAFQEVIMPVFKSAADYLRDSPIESNCVSMRMVEEVKIGFDNRVEVEVLGWFLRLQDIEHWTAHHPLHLAILKSSAAYQARLGTNSVITRGHEVFVVPEGHVVAEYANCHPDTGFLPYFPARDADVVSDDQ